MTRKDYVSLASALRNAIPASPEANLAWLSAVCAISDALMADNTHFDSDRFLEACGTQTIELPVYKTGE